MAAIFLYFPFVLLLDNFKLNALYLKEIEFHFVLALCAFCLKLFQLRTFAHSECFSFASCQRAIHDRLSLMLVLSINTIIYFP